MSPTALLLALHSLDPSKTGVKLKAVMGALDGCLSRREVFGKAVLASALQQLNQRATLPPLYMRFLMQVILCWFLMRGHPIPSHPSPACVFLYFAVPHGWGASPAAQHAFFCAF